MRFDLKFTLSTSALALTMGLATPAFAQTAEPQDPVCINNPDGKRRGLIAVQDGGDDVGCEPANPQ